MQILEPYATYLANPTKPSPFIKWAGGKGQLLNQLLPFFPTYFSTYYEPFLGGGAVFFQIHPLNAQLSDINPALINTYSQIKTNVNNLIQELIKLQQQYLRLKQTERETFFYQVRSLYNQTPSDTLAKAVYFIFLNKTCFNGLYRENSKGKFNVPFGRYDNPTIVDEKNLRAAHQALQPVSLKTDSFERVVETAQSGDFIYFDPPYHPLTTTSNFTSYTVNDFGEREQILLRDVFRKLDRNGVKVMLSNSCTTFIQSLYEGFNQIELQASRAINSKASGRGKIAELLITNYRTTQIRNFSGEI